MSEKPGRALKLGPDVIRHLLPHRRPFLMVDRIDSWQRAPLPVLTARRLISSNEDVFTGHFPGLNLWPGIFTIEGMGQCCNLAVVLSEIQRRSEADGQDPELPLEALRNLELGYQLRPGFRPELPKELLEKLAQSLNQVSLAAAVNVKFLAPVFAGQQLDYRVEQTHVVNGLIRFDVQASVENRPVATGTMTGAIGVEVLTPR